MPNAYLQGIQGTLENQAQIRNDIHVVATNWFVNRCPLVTRVPRLPAGSTTFTIVNRSVRSRQPVLAAAATASDTTLTFADASPLMNGDVIEMPTGERVELTATPNVATNTVTVRRGVEGTTPAAVAANTALLLIGNSRTGGEVDQPAVAAKPAGIAQYCQTWQHPVQISGSLHATTGFQPTPGLHTPLDQNRLEALQNLVDDMEFTSYYGLGEAPEVAARPKQKGLRALLTTNRTSAPASAAAYKPSDLIRDTLERCRVHGGDPDVLIVSSNFMTGLAIWGHAAQRLDAGATIFGTPIEVFEAPFLGGVTLIEAPLLKPFTAIALSSSEVRLRMKRNEFWNPRGSRGDAIEGDWVAEGAIEVENESHHAWVEGITAFSAV
jgi:hypothetical protein